MKTSKKKIVEWCQANISEMGYPVDADAMDKRCFRCAEERPTERCHVIPKSLGGVDEPHNYRLLCSECHEEAPNVNDSEAMDKWIIDSAKKWNPDLMYGVYWKNRKIFENTMEATSIHFGYGKMNQSTKEWVVETCKKKIADSQVIPAESLTKFVETLKNNTQSLDTKGLRTRHKIVQI
jgi:hypothetical protein